MINMMRFATRVGCVALAMLAVGCDGDSPPPHGDLLDGAQPSPSDEAERLRDMQLLRTVAPNGKVTKIHIGLDFYDSPADNGQSQFGKMLYESCVNRPQFAIDHFKERVQRWKCMSDLLYGMATDPGSISLEFSEAQASRLDLQVGTYTILPQNTATNSRLARAAAQAYWTTIQLITEYVTHEHVDLSTPGLTDGLLTAEEYGSIFVDSYYSAKDAYEMAVQSTLAVAHAERASTPSFELAQRRSISNPELSKMAAAHLLVGGQDGFLGDTTKAFCTSDRLSGPAKTAIALFRETGIDPKDLLNEDIPTRTLVEGPEAADPNNPGPRPANGSVKARLGDGWGRTLGDNQDVFTLYSLTEADFDAAREQLKNEIGIWNRSLTATMTDRPAANGHAPLYKHFGATAVPPRERDPWYWAGLAQTDPSAADEDATSQVWYPYATREDKELGSVPNFAALVDASLDAVETLLESDPVVSTSASEPRVTSGFIAPLSTLLNRSDRVARLTLCSYQAIMFGSLVGMAPEDAPHLLFGEDDMACATTGSVDGTPCSLTGHVYQLQQTNYDYGKQKPSPGATFFQTNLGGVASRLGQRFYIVKPRAAGNTAATPGQWEVVMSAPLYVRYGECYDVPIVPEAAKRVAEIMAPNPDWCGDSLYSCAGGRFDERLPLEDELTDDKDGVESSWRHYLTLARSAAQESDRLGEEYINSSLAADQREEELSLRATQQQEKASAELESLQDICGTAVDPAPLLAILGKSESGNYDLNTIDGGQCTGSTRTALPSGHPASEGWVCNSAGRAVLDWKKLGKKKPALRPLTDCIRSFADVTTTSLGDSDICAWKDSQGTDCGTEGVIADGYACPDIPHAVYQEDGTQTSECQIPPGATGNIVARGVDGLKLFSTVDNVTPPPNHSFCDSIRILRNNPAGNDSVRKDLLQKIIDSNRFDQVRLATQRRRLEFRATMGGYADVYLDSKRVFSTGSAETGPSQEWPCTAEGKANFCDPAGDDSLMCWQANCATPSGRLAAAARLFKAVAGAQLTSYGGGADSLLPIWRPLYLRHGAVPRDGLQSTIYWSTTQAGMSATAAPFNLASNDRWQMITGDIVVKDTMGNDQPMWAFGSKQWWLKDGEGRFAFGRTNPVDPPALRDKYWGGMSTGQDGNEAGDPKYFYTALSNGIPSTNVGHGIRVAYGKNVVVDVDCSDSCYISPWCTCNDSDSHRDYTDAELAKSLLSTSDPRGRPVTFADLSPIEYDFEPLSALDGLELMCEASEGFSDRGDGCGGPPPSFTSLADLATGGTYLKCLGDSLQNKAALMVLRDFPTAALDPLRAGKTTPKGQMGAAITSLRQALLRSAEAGPSIGRIVRDFGTDMKRLRETYALYDITDQMSDVEFWSTASTQATNCLVKTFDSTSISKTVDHIGGNLGAAAATCVNSVAQIGFASKLQDLKDKETQVQRQLAQADFDQRFSAHTEALQKSVLQSADSSEEIQKQLGVIHDLQARAERSVNKALWYLTQQAANQQEVTSVLAGKSKTAELRYRAAFNNAKRLSFLAARSIEQRLGVHLSEMRQKLPLVAAPSTWAPTICTTSGINYSKLRGTSPNGDGGAPYVFADAYIGDYLTKLENVVESYRLTENFHEGTDTAVVSLRDDVFNLRQDCDVDSPNLLYWASALNRVVPSGGDVERVGWEAKGCAQAADGSFLPNCIVVAEHKDAPFVDLRPQLRSVPGFTVQFGLATCNAATCGYRDGASIQQTTTLEPGRYRMSWFWASTGCDTMSSTNCSPTSTSALAGFVRKADGTAVTTTAGLDPTISTPTSWARQYVLFDVTDPGDYEVGFRKPNGGANGLKITVGAPMLEKLDDIAGQTSSDKPKLFSDTTDVRKSRMAVCQDTDGSVFREKEWTRGCTYLCPDGYSSNCADRAKQACYWETALNISQRQIEAGQQFKVSGFARGNFNYRINTLALNFVGSSLRSCDQSETPSACYSGGFIPYTLLHNGPYFVRNHQGIDFEAKLFAGTIEHARGLATERYISNPMGDSDRSLIDHYMRGELQGRPLDGAFLIRVWDEEGVEFRRIEDVQLVLNYSYWTRFE